MLAKIPNCMHAITVGVSNVSLKWCLLFKVNLSKLKKNCKLKLEATYDQRTKSLKTTYAAHQKSDKGIHLIEFIHNLPARASPDLMIEA